MFKVSPKLWKSIRDVRRAILNGVGVFAVVGLLLALSASGATAAPRRPVAAASSDHRKAESSM
jgi:hypothetical protein